MSFCKRTCFNCDEERAKRAALIEEAGKCTNVLSLFCDPIVKEWAEM